MRVKDAFSLASLNIFKTPLRSILTVLGLAIGVGAIVTVITLSDAGEKRVESEMARMGVNKVWIISSFLSERPLMAGDGETISQAVSLPACERAYALGPAGYGEKVALASITGCDQNMLKVHQVAVLKGRFFSAREEAAASDVAVLDKSMAEALGLADPVGESISVAGRYYRVVGVIMNQSAQAVQAQGAVYIPLNVFRSVIADKTDEVSLSVQSREQAETVRQHALSALPEEGIYDTVTLQEEIEAARTVIRIFVWVLASVAAICMLVGGIGVMNILLVSVHERRREIGVIKAIGGTDAQVLTLFLIEAAAYALLGGMIGIVLGEVMIRLSGSAIGMEAVLKGTTIAATVGAALVVGLFFGAAPAWKAARLLPVEALEQD